MLVQAATVLMTLLIALIRREDRGPRAECAVATTLTKQPTGATLALDQTLCNLR